MTQSWGVAENTFSQQLFIIFIKVVVVVGAGGGAEAPLLLRGICKAISLDVDYA